MMAVDLATSPKQIDRPSWQLPLIFLGLTLLAGAVYWPVHQFGFLNYDDQTYVWQNPHMRAGLTGDGLHYAFSATFGGWSPLVWISILIDRQLFGATPGLMHIENVAWHVLGGILLCVLLTRSTEAPYRGALVAAIFLCHPMHVESVAWISERKDVLSTPLLLGAMLAYCQYCTWPREATRWRWYVLMLVLYVLSLMTKATGITLPLLLLLIDYWPLRRMPQLNFRDAAFRGLLVEKLPIIAITVTFAAVALYAQKAAGATAAAINLPLLDRVYNAIVCYVIYIAKLIVPTDLAAFYPHPGLRPFTAVAAATGILILVTGLAIRHRARIPYFLVGWLWFAIALLPMIGLVQLGGQAMADRYSYLPSIGLFVAIVWGACDVFQYAVQARDSRTARVISGLVAILIITGLSFMARRQVWYWKNTETLFLHSYEVTGPNPVACFAIGAADYGRGDLRGALENFTTVVEQDPGNDKALKILGDIWVNTEVDRAIDDYSQAVAIKPDKTDYRIKLAAALTRKGDDASLNSAAVQLLRVLQMEPGNSQANMGLVDVRGRLRVKQMAR